MTVLRTLAGLALSAAFALPALAADTEPSSDDTMARLEQLMESREARLMEGWQVTLAQALEVALSQAPNVMLEEAAVRVAETRVDSTRSAYRPTITLSAGIELSTGSGYVAGSTQLGGGSTRTTATSLNASLSADQLIYDFGRTAARRRAAQANVAYAQASQAQLQQDIRSEVMERYLRAGAAREQMLVALQTRDAERQRARQIEGYVEVGLRPSIDLATARANVASATARFVDAETSYDLATFDLLATMGVTEEHELHVVWTELDTQELESLDLQELQRMAESQRGEFRQLAASITAAEEGILATRNDMLPTLRAYGGVSESFLIGRTGRWNAYIGARLGWTLYQGGQLQFQRREQEAELARLSAEEQLFINNAVQQIRRAQRSIRGAEVALATHQILVENATRQLELAQGRYETGMGNIVELSDAQLALTEAQFATIEAALALSLARVELVAAVAGWGEEP